MDSKDFQCPHCKAEFDAYEFAEGGLHEEGEHEEVCPECGKKFIVGASNTWSWEGKCMPEDHKFVEFSDKLMICENCSETELKSEVKT